MMRQGIAGRWAEGDAGNAALMQYYVGVIARLDGLNAALAAADRLAADPQPARGAGAQGHIYVAAGQFADAIAAYGAELRSNPTSALVLRNARAQHRRAGGPGRQGLRDWWRCIPTISMSRRRWPRSISSRTGTSTPRRI